MSNKKSLLSLIVDGNWLLMSRLSILRMRIKDEDKLLKELKIMMIKSMNVMMRNFSQIDNIIFVADGGSWRNGLEIPVFLKKDHITYKGNREKDKDLDWDKVFATYDEFVNTLSESGICVSREKGVEGDDWCAYWSKTLNSKNTNVIIWSADRDLTQLVHTDPKSKCFTICWNKNYMTMELIEHNSDDMDFFFDFDNTVNQQLLENISIKAKDIHEIHPMDVVIDKIVRGDAGDNILPIVQKKGKSSDKLFRVAQKELDLSMDITRLDEITAWVEELLNKKTWQGKVDDKTEDQIVEHFEYNRRLVWLDPSSYPDEVLEKMRNHHIESASNDLSIAMQKIQAEKNEVTDILEEI